MKVVEKAHYTLEPRYSFRMQPKEGIFPTHYVYNNSFKEQVVEGLRDSHKVIMFLLYGKALAANECLLVLHGVRIEIVWWKNKIKLVFCL